MEDIIKDTIAEAFKSKNQAAYFYARANDKSLSFKERKKWKKWAKEFSDKTNFKKLPQKAAEEEDMSEIVDADGNIDRNPKPINANVKGVTSYSTTDGSGYRPNAMGSAYGSMGGNIPGGAAFKPGMINYWIGESDMSDVLGHEVIDKNLDYDEAQEYFETELELPPDETKERLNKMGYDEELPEDKIRLIENPKEYIENYVESIMAKRSKENDMVEKDESDYSIDKEPNPIILKQIEALKNALKADGIPVNRIIKYLKHE